ncbi:single-stranded DNA-binding protein [Micromonospora rosaria]|uniref:Single-stranded DNA-binding protein n=1 Tax=Micromonospora rosaria TaxID=47874 RepID=A0A136PL98_9ACTN|nr:single-stranded DNA-binding protein [Micromonospora rosaria]KXK59189.1 single-stranded DNA-binding protein [Micromonospora rosaria]
MFETNVTVVGNVLTAPEWRRTAQSNTLVANFKVASTARRLDRDSGRWVDGNSLRVRVNCWRKLAEGVAASVMVGDPVVVAGRLYTRDWTDEAGNHRTHYELEAVSVGHDLARGRSRFVRNRPTATTSAVEDAEAERRVHGEPTEPVPAEQAPSTVDDRPFDDEFELPSLGAPRRGPSPLDMPPLGGGPRGRSPLAESGPDDGPAEDLSPVADLGGARHLSPAEHLSPVRAQTGAGDLDALPDEDPLSGRDDLLDEDVLPDGDDLPDEDALGVAGAVDGGQASGQPASARSGRSRRARGRAPEPA